MASGTSIGIKRAAPASQGATERVEWHRRASRLHEELRRPAIALVRRAYGSAFAADEIEDVYSSAWLGTLRALERKEAELDDDAVRSYVLTAVANHASKEIRRRRRKPVAPMEAAGAVADVAATPEDSATSNEASRITRDLLASLPPRRRAVMLLRYGWGLAPAEVCGMVKGLSPRAYRKEITRGVDELTAKLKLVDEGAWCAERESLLKAYASGLASDDQALQAKQHLAHCRHCHDFVGKLAGHLHDFGGAILVPGALEAVDPDVTLLERLGEAGDRVRESVVGATSRADAGEVVSTATAARGAGAAGAGVAAKLAGIGTAGKLALACLGGGAAATACVAAGIGPIAIGGNDAGSTRAAVEKAVATRPAVAPVTSPVPAAPHPGGSASAPEEQRPTNDAATAETDPAVAPDAPPVQQQFGVAAAAQPVSGGSGGDSGGGDGGDSAVQQEFGP